MPPCKHYLPLILSSLIFSGLFTSCKTTEEVAREKKMDDMSNQFGDNQKLSANMSIRIVEVQTRVAKLEGRIQEVDHSSKKAREEEIGASIKQLQEQTGFLEKKSTEHSLLIENIEKQLKEQKKFLQNITNTLKNLSSGRRGKKKSSKRSASKPLSPVDSAMKLYRRGAYTKARSAMEQLIQSKNISKQNKAHLYHNLGMIHFIQKKNDLALIYFSKLYKEFPKSSFNKNGLLHLGKTLLRKGQKDQAKNALNELLKQHPTSKSAKEAKKVLPTIK